MRLPRVILTALLLAGICGAWPLGGTATAGPRAEIAKTTHDFGEVFEDRSLAHTFEIKNTGDAPLVIKHIDSDCACTAAEADRRIAPGGVGRITLTIAPYSVLRQFDKKTTLSLNDPARPQIVLSMKGYGRPAVEIQPSHIIRFEGRAGQDLRRQVRIISHLPEPMEIKSYRTNVPDAIDVRLIPESPGRIFVVEVTNKRQGSGVYSGMIELFTNLQKRPRLLLRVFGEISSPAS